MNEQMTAQEIERYFKEYIFGFIQNDIQREIDLARGIVIKGGGNVLAALGLLCYTEFMGNILMKERYDASLKKSKYHQWFDAFFVYMGEPYERLIEVDNRDIYHDLRCGMAHTYFAKKCVIKMLDNNYPAGIVLQPDPGHKYLFIVQRYFTDFTKACESLYFSMLIEPHKWALPST